MSGWWLSFSAISAIRFTTWIACEKLASSTVRTSAASWAPQSGSLGSASFN